MSRRRLTPDEIELWQRIASQAQRLHPERAPPAPLPKPKPTKRPPPRIDPFDLGSGAPPRASAHDLRAPLPERLGSAPLNMDRKTHTRMTRGKLVPEGRIDLHGMTLERAHPALTRFVLSAQSQGKRLVLVITGKGRPRADDGPIPTPRGILKHQVPQWLSMPPLSRAVLQIRPAHISHGGEGAYYVYLRKGA